MTVPVIKLLLQQYPHLQVTYVSTAFVAPLFAGIERLHFHVIEPKGKHKGFRGLYALKKELRQHHFDAIADLHNVLRTQILRSFFLLSGKTTAVIDKGRKEKAELTRVNGKVLRPLKSTFQRYAEVFAELGVPVNLHGDIPKQKMPEDGNVAKSSGNERSIGIAPFAKHAEKTYPPEKMQEVIALLVKEKELKIYLFGGKEDAATLNSWAAVSPQIISVAGAMPFSEELGLISRMDLMVSMDSANMHLASLFGVPVVSIWGSTHPLAGFYGWHQDPKNIVQVDLYCRPCSVFGNRKCYRGDLACLHSINPVTVYDRIAQQLYKQQTS
ncbi:MAG: ADP-heptose:LPS heptosyltransferase [Flaviaesturariibacter sp.]|nr:ADP-heptose:LPS heptosyltransferase [Flaviaesturariibacter sp.]